MKAVIVVAALALAAGALWFRFGRPAAPLPPSPPAARAAPPRPVVEPLPAKKAGFEGRWAGPGSLTTKCGKDPQSVDEDELDITVTRKGTGLAVTRGTCTYLFDVRKNAATIRPGQRCPSGDGQVESWTLTLADDERALDATMAVALEAAPGVRCLSKLRGTLDRR